jgi:hypothetical protein
MKRYKSSFQGMKESESGEWVQYPIFELLREKCLENDELAKQRLHIIHERNSEISVMKKTAEESYKKNQGIIDRINTQYNALNNFVKAQDNTINNLDAINKKLKIESKFTDLKHDIFIFSVVLNLILVLTMVAFSFDAIISFVCERMGFI